MFTGISFLTLSHPTIGITICRKKEISSIKSRQSKGNALNWYDPCNIPADGTHPSGICHETMASRIDFIISDGFVAESRMHSGRCLTA